MVKLFTDEEMNEKCKDYDPIPMKVAQDILHLGERDDKVNILNGVIKSPYKTGQAPANVNMYANGIERFTKSRVKAELFIQEYNKVVDVKMEEQEKELEQMGEEDVDAPKEPDTLEE